MRATKDALVILGSCLLLGAVCGVGWWLLVDPAMFTKVRGGGVMGEVALIKKFDADGWYAVVAGICGMAAGGLLTAWRSRDFLLTTALLVAGGAVAAAAMAATGHLLGPGEPDAALAAARLGDGVPVQLGVSAKASYLVWPIALLAGALMVLWSQPGEVGDDPAA